MDLSNKQIQGTIMSKIKVTQSIMVSLVCSLLALASTNSYAESLDELTKKQPVTVSFFMDVEPGTKSFISQNGQIGTKQVTISKINEQLYNGKTLIVKSITVEHLSLPFPNPESYSVVALARCAIKSGSIGGFGNSSISTYGLQSNSMYYNPGLVVHLDEKHVLCVSSYIQSNEKARIFVHGILLDKS